jgi:dihydroorotate dehydrogenase
MDSYMKPLIVSAPFGNYHRILARLTGADFTPTLGTFTWEPRGFLTKPYGGRFLRVALTVRYSWVLRAWRNRIGLKNPGLRWYRDRVRAGRADATDKIVSVYGWTLDEWDNLFRTLQDVRPLAVELNLACPNVDRPLAKDNLFILAQKYNFNYIAKIPPINYQKLVATAYANGIRVFHATNSLSTPTGGMSGEALTPLALAAVRYLRETYPDVFIIGGGGIRHPADAIDFLTMGANRVAIGSMLFNPFNWSMVRPIAEAAGRGQTLMDFFGAVRI